MDKPATRRVRKRERGSAANKDEAAFFRWSFGADALQDYAVSSNREWLVTNGLGGYALSTLAGVSTRRYDGLLVAVVGPPGMRRVGLSRLEAEAIRGDQGVPLATNQYPGALHPTGYCFLERFDAYPAPTFAYRPFPDSLLVQRVWMGRGRNTTYISYTLAEADSAIRLRLTPLVCWKDYHAEMRARDDFPASVEGLAGKVCVHPGGKAPTLRVLAAGAEWEPGGYWYYSFEHQKERERGFPWTEDLYCAGHLLITLEPGATATVIATIEPGQPQEATASWDEHLRHLDEVQSAIPADDAFGRELAVAGDAFIVPPRHAAGLAVRRGAPSPPAEQETRATIVAGYPWFAEWGRDTMISLPGLCLPTRRFAEARAILLAAARFASDGMIPNRFPENGGEPEYNSIDATLWYLRAVDAYCHVAPDGLDTARELWPVLVEVVDWYMRGTRYGIRADPRDGLLGSTEPTTQLTWMDASVDGTPVTPRVGKPVEVNALWYGALVAMAGMAGSLGEGPRRYESLAARVRDGFRGAFVRADGDGLHDVVGVDGPSTEVRPNQVFAVSLPHSPLTAEQQKAVVDVIARDLLTPVGLRTLPPSSPAYCGRYLGPPPERDRAYHQGTVWPWLLGPFAEAHYRVYGDVEAALGLLRPLRDQMAVAGIGSLPEVCDGDAPHAPGGCIAQAWSVAETLRVWRFLRGLGQGRARNGAREATHASSAAA
ncbi:MAG: glycogen debranching enzyme family protein [Chthonomonadales bacterium]|nr:glycogen debranching enzyme family protein [Chthonomonadales bacterium]